MGAGATKSLARTHGPSKPDGSQLTKGDGSHVNGERGGGLTHRSASARGARSAGAVAADPDNRLGHKASPLDIDGGAGDPRAAMGPLGDDGEFVSEHSGGFGHTQVEAILGKAGSNAKYLKKRPIGKGAYGEAYIVERNPLYNPASCPLAEQQVLNNQLAHPTRVGGTYVIKVMDLRNMRQQDRQYAQTEIICIAHTHHFAIIRYYEHYVLDSGDETMVIVTEFADHGDLSRNLNRVRDAHRLADAATTLTATSESTSSAGISGHSGGGVAAATGLSSSPAQRVQAVAALQLTEKEAGMYFVQLLAALHHIHKRRMIHRDVKSANLFLTSHGFIKLGDFGFSQKYESTVSSETIAGTFLGTPYYVSPEMWKGTRYGKKADVWAAGIVLYEMLMDGQRPFDAMGLTDLKRVVLDRDVELPESPPAPKDGSSTKRGIFSPEIRALVKLIFQKDPKKRPSTEELLRTPIMQHYLFLFQRHVHGLIAADAALVASHADGALDRSRLAFPDEADKLLVLEGLEELTNTIKEEIQREMEEPGALRYEGVVYKGNRDGSWKERYLALEDDVLAISLSKAKSAAEGTERSRKVPMKLVKAVNMVQSSDPHVQPMHGGDGASGRFVPPYSFVLFMQESSSPIYFGVASAQELDNWMRVLMKALHID